MVNEMILQGRLVADPELAAGMPGTDAPQFELIEDEEELPF